ncbi:hypothetical protein QAD02_012372 [Eretmocerus hayati]|uniref:Uncharacterized protein n=1 Tax=Eretmocerus hayati TaxID=131215 RepID=A0ACC2NZ95_9HYME|nr:hypothetical protein QAD02_012372 [Eretmocerus hayati]
MAVAASETRGQRTSTLREDTGASTSNASFPNTTTSTSGEAAAGSSSNQQVGSETRSNDRSHAMPSTSFESRAQLINDTRTPARIDASAGPSQQTTRKRERQERPICPPAASAAPQHGASKPVCCNPLREVQCVDIASSDDDEDEVRVLFEDRVPPRVNEMPRTIRFEHERFQDLVNGYQATLNPQIDAQISAMTTVQDAREIAAAPAHGGNIIDAVFQLPLEPMARPAALSVPEEEIPAAPIGAKEVVNMTAPASPRIEEADAPARAAPRAANEPHAAEQENAAQQALDLSVRAAAAENPEAVYQLEPVPQARNGERPGRRFALRRVVGEQPIAAAIAEDPAINHVQPQRAKENPAPSPDASVWRDIVNAFASGDKITEHLYNNNKATTVGLQAASLLSRGDELLVEDATHTGHKLAEEESYLIMARDLIDGNWRIIESPMYIMNEELFYNSLHMAVHFPKQYSQPPRPENISAPRYVILNLQLLLVLLQTKILNVNHFERTAVSRVLEANAIHLMWRELLVEKTGESNAKNQFNNNQFAEAIPVAQYATLKNEISEKINERRESFEAL